MYDRCCPALGSASIRARVRSTDNADIVAPQVHTASCDWQEACNLQKVHVRTQSPSVSRGAWHLIRALPKQSRIKSLTPHPTAFLVRESGVWLTNVSHGSSSETTVGIDRNRFLQGFRTGTAPLPLTRSILWIEILLGACGVLSRAYYRRSRCHCCM